MTQSILWDLDGVLIDSLTPGFQITNKILQKNFGKDIQVSHQYIKSIFANEVPVYWKLILEVIKQDFGVNQVKEKYEDILQQYNTYRKARPFKLQPGVKQILETCKNTGLRQAVVSNNPLSDLKKILRNTHIVNYFDVIVGNDVVVNGKELRKKPYPDAYLYAASQCKTSPKNCVVIEDSAIGIQAGKSAGCYVVGVATGSASIEDLQALDINAMYVSFQGI